MTKFLGEIKMNTNLKTKVIQALRLANPLVHLSNEEVVQALREAYPDEDRFAGKNDDLVAFLRAKALRKAAEELFKGEDE